MTQTAIFLSCSLWVSTTGFSQGFEGKVDSASLPQTSPSHYQPEYAIDAPVDLAAWKKLKPGMHVAFGSTEQLFFRTEVPQVTNESNGLEATAWKGERLN